MPLLVSYTCLVTLALDLTDGHTAQEEAEANTSDAGPAKELSDAERPESPLSSTVISGASDSIPEDLVVEDPIVAEHMSCVKSILGQLSRLAVAIRNPETKTDLKR